MKIAVDTSITSKKKVLVTGATGYIGQQVVRTLIKKGYLVTAIGRNKRLLKIYKDLGARILAGDLFEIDIWKSAIFSKSSIIHLAMADEKSEELDNLVCNRVIKETEHSQFPITFIYTSGTMPFGNTGPNGVDEFSPFGQGEFPRFLAWRPKQEKLLLEAANSRLNVKIIRPGFVYGGTAGLFKLLLDQVSETGIVRLPGTGKQHWSLVQVEDLARLYTLALENGKTGIYHGVENRIITAAEVAEALAKSLTSDSRKWQSWLISEAAKSLGWLAEGLALDQIVLSRTVGQLGWRPKKHNLLEQANLVVNPK